MWAQSVAEVGGGFAGVVELCSCSAVLWGSAGPSNLFQRSGSGVERSLSDHLHSAPSAVQHQRSCPQRSAALHLRTQRRCSALIHTTSTSSCPPWLLAQPSPLHGSFRTSSLPCSMADEAPPPADDPRLGAKPANVDDADWRQLQGAFASVTSPGFGIRPQDENPVLGNGQPQPHLHHPPSMRGSRSASSSASSAPLTHCCAAASFHSDPKLEENWATAAMKHAETYIKLLRAFKDKRKLRLTPSAHHTHHTLHCPTLASPPLTSTPPICPVSTFPVQCGRGDLHPLSFGVSYAERDGVERVGHEVARC